MMPRNKKRGFTLLEMIVTLSVFMIMTTIMISSNRNTTKTVVLNTLANQVISVIRQSESYALTKPALSIGNYPPYGVYFSTGSPSSFILFKDTNKDHLYTEGESLQNLTFQPGFTIAKLCVNMKKNNKTPTTCTSVTNIDVSFTRPYPEPTITTTTSTVGEIPFTDVEIILSSGAGNIQKTIVVWVTGQLAIE